jgi:hypothetical protein
MTVATLPGFTDAELCQSCTQVMPARSLSQCTRERALVLLVRGYCMCPREPGGAATLDPEARVLRQELTATMYQPVDFADDPEEPATTVDLVPVDESEDIWVEAPQGPSSTAYVLPPTYMPAEDVPLVSGSDRRYLDTQPIEAVELRPLDDPASPTLIWTHPPEPPEPVLTPVLVIDGGSITTGPQALPTPPPPPSPSPFERIRTRIRVVRSSHPGRRIRTG